MYIPVVGVLHVGLTAHVENVKVVVWELDAGRVAHGRDGAVVHLEGNVHL